MRTPLSFSLEAFYQASMRLSLPTELQEQAKHTRRGSNENRMLGTFEKPGIMALTFNELFSKMKNSQEFDYALKYSYLEIYNENIRDLLVPTDGT